MNESAQGTATRVRMVRGYTGSELLIELNPPVAIEGDDDYYNLQFQMQEDLPGWEMGAVAFLE